MGDEEKQTFDDDSDGVLSGDDVNGMFADKPEGDEEEEEDDDDEEDDARREFKRMQKEKGFSEDGLGVKRILKKQRYVFGRLKAEA